MAVTIEHTGNPLFPWRVSSDCVTKAECFAKAARIEEVIPEAFQPVPVESHHAAEAPMPPALEELVARAESDDPQVGSLKAEEAFGGDCK